MARRVRQALIAGVVIAVLLILGVGVVPASAAIADKAFTAIGCNVGDYNCFYSKMGGSTDTYYCQTGYYECTNGVTNAPQQFPTAGVATNYCQDGAAYIQNGTYGCYNGNPIGAAVRVSTDPNSTSSSGGPTVVIAGNFASAGLGAKNVTGAARQP